MMRRNLKALVQGCLSIPLSAALLGAAESDLRLLKAVEQQDKSAIRALLDDGVDVNAAEADGTTALHWAAHRNDTETAGSLLRVGAAVNAANDYGVTALSLACLNRNSEFVALLLQANANPNLAQWTGETPLMTCARTGSTAAVKALLDHGADPHAKESNRGQTALMWALSERHPQVAVTLIERGADIQTRS